MEALVLGFIVVMILAVVLTTRTRLWWLPGAVMIVLGMIAFGSVSVSPSQHDDYGFAAMGDLFILCLAGGSAVVGMLLLAFAANARGRRQPAPVPPLPVATMIER